MSNVVATTAIPNIRYHITATPVNPKTRLTGIANMNTNNVQVNKAKSFITFLLLS